MTDFKVNRSLLNAKFEGYKLDPIDQERVVSRYALQNKPTQATVSHASPLTFPEVQSRITHNHLAVHEGGTRALYIDVGHQVIVIDIETDTSKPTFRVLCALPVPFQSDTVDLPHAEYPSAAFLDEHSALVSDGHGRLYALEIKDNAPTGPLAVYTLPKTSLGVDAPFRIHSATFTSPTTAVILLSSRNYDQTVDAEVSPPRKHKSKPKFDVWAVRVALPLASNSNISTLEVLWNRQGNEVPIFAGYDISRESYMIVGGSIYHPNHATPPLSYEPSADEVVPVPRAGENLDGATQYPEKPPPYSWTQTPDSVTVAFPLPSSTSKTDIRVMFSPQTLTVLVADVASPRYSAKRLWDGISPSASFWTWDREAENSFGLLTLHLDKQHEGSKWMQVFAAAGASASAQTNSEDVEVPETLDPSELWHIRESFEKITAAVRDGDDASGLGLGRGVPQLAEGEMDEDVDASIGRTAYATWVASDGTVPSWYSDSRQTPFTLLSTSLPGIGLPDVSLVVKENLDGAVYIREPADHAGQSPCWKHVSTFSALAFVLASKQDTRFTYHIPHLAALAFENGSRERGGNVYVYRAAHKEDKWAKQAILKVGDGIAGSLLGVGGVRDSAGAMAIMCLTENELIIVNSVL